jgi:hypothetical protein
VNGASALWWSSGGEARWNLPSEAVILSVHVGASEVPASFPCSQLPDRVQAAGMEVEVYCFKPSLAIDMQEADLVISHAGAGCIMESLRSVYPIWCATKIKHMLKGDAEKHTQKREGLCTRGMCMGAPDKPEPAAARACILVQERAHINSTH